MDKFKRSLTQFLVSNNAWIFAICLTVISFMWVMTFRTTYGSMVYLHSTKWMLFGCLSAALFIVFFPSLFFGLFREIIKSKASSSAYKIIWMTIFIGYPFLLFTTNLFQNIIPVSMTSEMLGIFAFFITMVELITNPLSSQLTRLDFSWLRKKISIEGLVILLFIVLSLYMTFHLKMSSAVESSFVLVWIQALVLTSLYYLFYLITHYYLVNQIYRRKGLVYFSFSFIGLVALFYVPTAAIHYYFPALKTTLQYRLGEDWVGSDAPTAFWAIHSGVPYSLTIIGIPLTIFIQWFKQSSRIDNLERQKSETELNLLKQQINPHFFFNTLNNVYSMSLTKDEKTSEGILQLSELMRYVIYKGKEKTVTLDEEIKYIEDYLELQKLRLSNKLDLLLQKNIENEDFRITPLLFIILIENAFKHGIEGAENETFLHISISQKGNDLKFECINSLENEQVESHKGMGLENLKHRLELLYPEQYSLTYERMDTQYRAVLQLSTTK